MSDMGRINCYQCQGTGFWPPRDSDCSGVGTFGSEPNQQQGAQVEPPAAEGPQPEPTLGEFLEAAYHGQLVSDDNYMLAGWVTWIACTVLIWVLLSNKSMGVTGFCTMSAILILTTTILPIHRYFRHALLHPRTP